MAQPTPVYVTDPNGNGYNITGATGTGGHVAQPTPVVLTDKDGNALAFGAGVTPNGTTATTQAPLSNDTKVATDAYADAAVAVETSARVTAEALLAPKASAALTGTPTAPTATVFDNSTKLATTAYVDQSCVSGAEAFLEDDFTTANSATVSASAGYSAETGWSVAPITGGTTGTLAGAASTIQNPGQVVITTTAVSGQGISLYKGGGANNASPLGILGANTGWQLDYWFVIPATITNYCVRVGVAVAGQQIADAPSGGFWLEFDTANASSNTNFELRTVNASTSNYVSSGVAPTASHVYHVRFTSTVAGTIKCQLGDNNGALGAAFTTSTDVDTTHACLPIIQVLPRTTAAVTLNVDRYSHLLVTGRV